MQFETDRLVLRPVKVSDTQAIADVVFSDPNVVGMLAHNTRDPEDAIKEAARWTKVMGIDGNGGIWDKGGIGLFAIVPKNADQMVAGVAGFYMELNDQQRWDGEYFYALGTNWHGLGLMSEAASVFARHLKEMPDLGVIYACYWDMINEASGRLLEKTGLTHCGRKLLMDEYDEVRCRRMFEYDLWRLAKITDSKSRDEVAVQGARRAGAFVAESAIEQKAALGQIADAYAVGALPIAVADMFNAAVKAPGMAYFEIRGTNTTG